MKAVSRKVEVQPLLRQRQCGRRVTLLDLHWPSEQFEFETPALSVYLILLATVGSGERRFSKLIKHTYDQQFHKRD